MQKNKTAKIDFNHFGIQKNKVVLDLLTHMLEADPEKRFSAKECLQHPYFDDTESKMIIEEPAEPHFVGAINQFKQQYEQLKQEIQEKKTYSIVI